MKLNIKGKLDRYGIAIVQSHLINFGLSYESAIDTGSSLNFISGRLAEELGLIEVEQVTSNNPVTGITRQPVYVLNFKIGELEQIFQSKFSRMPKEFNYPIILGCEFLSICEFNYNGVDGFYEIIVAIKGQSIS